MSGKPLRFRLRTMLLLLTAACIPLGILATKWHREAKRESAEK